jgi:hypothetical protein
LRDLQSPEDPHRILDKTKPARQLAAQQPTGPVAEKRFGEIDIGDA